MACCMKVFPDENCLQKCVKIGFNFVRLFLNWFKLRLHCLLPKSNGEMNSFLRDEHSQKRSLFNQWQFQTAIVQSENDFKKCQKIERKKKLVQTYFLVWNMLICEKSKKLDIFRKCCESMWLFSEPKSIGSLISKS